MRAFRWPWSCQSCWKRSSPAPSAPSTPSGPSSRRTVRTPKAPCSCLARELNKPRTTKRSAGSDFREGQSPPIQELSLPRRHVLGQHVLALVGEVVLGLVDAGTRYVSGCMGEGVLDLLKRTERGGLKTLALELRWLLRWYWPSGLSSRASWLT